MLTLAGIATIAGPIPAGWNESHIFNERWLAHARFHGVVALSTAAALSAFAVARLWLPFGDRAVRRDVAAAVPLVCWGSFFPAAIVWGTGLDDPPHAMGRIAEVPATCSSDVTARRRTCSSDGDGRPGARQLAARPPR